MKALLYTFRMRVKTGQMAARGVDATAAGTADVDIIRPFYIICYF